MKPASWLGLDVGWVFPIADSDGNVYQWTRQTRPSEWIAKAGPVTITKPDGRVTVRPPYSLAEAAQHLARAEGKVHVLALHVVCRARDTDRGLAVENWEDFKRRKAAWIRVWKAVISAAEERDIPIMQVDRAYTSLTCPKCGHKARGNRISRDRFRCELCVYSGHADVIAAMNIAAKAAGTFEVASRTCSNPACDRVQWSAQLCVRCYHFRRRHGRLPSQADLKLREQSRDERDYRARRQKRVLEERRRMQNAALEERMAESYRTHDAWGNPLPA